MMTLPLGRVASVGYHLDKEVRYKRDCGNMTLSRAGNTHKERLSESSTWQEAVLMAAACYYM